MMSTWLLLGPVPDIVMDVWSKAVVVTFTASRFSDADHT